ncbi:hypothetical protein ACYULU_13235 [Breznakiellaceae bacterium SP9]
MMQAVIKLSFVANGEEYNLELAIPGTKPLDSVPFRFVATRGAGDEAQAVLHVAIGDKSYYVAVEPPRSILEAANLGDIVKELRVLVADGGSYDPKNCTFSLPAAAPTTH